MEKRAGLPDQITGLLQVMPKGFGFLRQESNRFMPGSGDPFVPPDLIREYQLKEGVLVTASTKKGGQPGQVQAASIIEVDGFKPEQMKNLPSFESLTPINPSQQLKMETTSDRMTTRVLDIITPVGKGQRGLIVAPPRTGKTILLQHIANGITQNYPAAHLIVLLIDERPEEVTDMRRMIQGEVVASSSDRQVKEHVATAQLMGERAKRLVEQGKDVVILLDSITRLGRAFNHASSTGRTLSGGLDSRAMEFPRRLFGLARQCEGAGSLTILATALIDTGSKMDQVIFEEFKGTGNMELVLDRSIAEKRIWPAIDINKSGTRREELILSKEAYAKATLVRRALSDLKPVDAIELLLKKMESTQNNEAFFELLAKQLKEK